MSKSTNNKQKELLNTITSTEETPSKSSTLAESIEIENTPFVARRFEDYWLITMGDYKITPNYKTKEEAINHLETNKWLTITTLVSIIIEKILEQEKTNITPYETESL